MDPQDGSEHYLIKNITCITKHASTSGGDVVECFVTIYYYNLREIHFLFQGYISISGIYLYFRDIWRHMKPSLSPFRRSSQLQVHTSKNWLIFDKVTKR